MAHSVLGLHHVTATVDDAQDDLNFSVATLGQRLVKRTVNFDNPGVFHFYYGNEHGTPGTIWTTFPYKDKGVRPGSHGRGQVTTTAFSVPAGSLDAWSDRLTARGIRIERAASRFGDDVIRFSDSSGLTFELVASASDDRAPWVREGIGASTAIRGLHSVTLTIPSPNETLPFLKRFLGVETIDQAGGRIRVGAGSDAPGRVIDLVSPADAPPAINGIGTVHHVALAVSTPDEQLAIRRELLGVGWRVTEVRDRQYFQSIYFREPGGVLLEVATVSPGFGVDEPVASLGEALKLPPWEEADRPRIEAELPPIVMPA
jgi:glyoxalase family protein